MNGGGRTADVGGLGAAAGAREAIGAGATIGLAGAWPGRAAGGGS
jgi:hypothetical protein